ncbi:hypothetical protein [Patulibacter sp. SYSU D01012]|uniref:hypothetical protein n=1 Tax=Patulibacter sp. SYSU D01012 TaxID=2817381 RepID=UPI001B30E2F4|nr:hypothetical protein [Patulibacter sp. SYSU D01012]
MLRAWVAGLVVCGVLAGCGGAGPPSGPDAEGGRRSVVTVRAKVGGGRLLALASAGTLRLGDLPQGWETHDGGAVGQFDGVGCPGLRGAVEAAAADTEDPGFVVRERASERVLHQLVLAYRTPDAARRRHAAAMAPGERRCIAGAAGAIVRRVVAGVEYGTHVRSVREDTRSVTRGAGDSRYVSVDAEATVRGSVIPLRVVVGATRVGRAVSLLLGVGVDDSTVDQADEAIVRRLERAGAARR